MGVLRDRDSRLTISVYYTSTTLVGNVKYILYDNTTAGKLRDRVLVFIHLVQHWKVMLNISYMIILPKPPKLGSLKR